MPQELGDATGPGDHAITYTGDGSASAGDAVAIDQSSGKASQTNSADTGGSEEFAGVTREDFGADGATESIVTEAPTGIIVNCASGVAAGDRLDVSATAGQLASSSGGPVLAISDEGGTTKTGESLAANECEVVF